MISPLVVTATLEDIFGIPYPEGTVIFQLENFGASMPTVSIGSYFMAPLRVIATADSGGLISTLIWGNDMITPSGTYYLVTFMSDKHLVTAQCKYYLTGLGTVDLSTLTPS